MATTVALAVANASEEPVIASGARLGTSRSAWPFLPTSSSVINGKALNFIVPLYDQTISPSQFDELAEYLALSTCCHALDGWRYLSMSAIALLNGARGEALHMAYYAELRAALSILAGSGIGILNTKHFSLTAIGTVNWFPGLTHNTAWEAIRQWSQSLPNAVNVVDSFDALGLNTVEWVEACRASSSRDAIASHWLMDWSIDLTSLTTDRDIRNEASYRPDLTWNALHPLSDREFSFVRNINSACSAIGYGQFEYVDLALVHDLCSKACYLRYGSSKQSDMQKLWAEVSRWLTSHKGLDRGDAFSLIQTVKSAPNTSGGKLLSSADISNKSSEGVFSRALLLLRLASALQRRQWREIRLRALSGKADWQDALLSNYAAHSNLCDQAAIITNYEIFDEDQVEAQEDIDGWLKGRRKFNPHRLWKDKPGALFQLCRFERIGILAAAL